MLPVRHFSSYKSNCAVDKGPPKRSYTNLRNDCQMSYSSGSPGRE